MSKYKKLSHVIYQCKYHIVFVPKYRYKVLEGIIKTQLEEDIRMYSIQKDHVHLVVSIPPRVSLSEYMGVIKGKTAIKMFKSYPQLKKKPYWGNHFWTPGYFANTIGLDEEIIKRYVKYQEEEEKKEEQQSLNFSPF